MQILPPPPAYIDAVELLTMEERQQLKPLPPPPTYEQSLITIISSSDDEEEKVQQPQPPAIEPQQQQQQQHRFCRHQRCMVQTMEWSVLLAVVIPFLVWAINCSTICDDTDDDVHSTKDQNGLIPAMCYKGSECGRPKFIWAATMVQITIYVALIMVLGRCAVGCLRCNQ